MAANVDENVHVSTDPTPSDWQRFAERHFNWNFVCGLLSAIVAVHLASSTTFRLLTDIAWRIKPSFLGAHPLSPIGTLTHAIGVAEYVPLLFIAYYIETRERKMPTFVVLAVISCLCLAMCSLVVFFLVPAAPVASLVMIPILQLVFLLSTGAAGLIMTDMFGKAFPLGRRSGFFGAQAVVALVPMLLMAPLSRLFVSPEKTSEVSVLGYAISYLAALGLVGLGYLAFYCMKEPVHEARQEEKPVGQYLRDSFRTAIIQDTSYRAFLVVCILQIVGMTSTMLGLETLPRELDLPYSAWRSIVWWIPTVGFILWPAFGYLGNAVGSKVFLWICSISGVVGSIGLAPLMLLAPKLKSAYSVETAATVALSLYACMLVVTRLTMSSHYIGQVNYTLDIAPARLRPTYIAIIGTVIGLLHLGIQNLGRGIVDNSSAPIVFLLGGVCFLLSFVPLRRMRNVTVRKQEG